MNVEKVSKDIVEISLLFIIWVLINAFLLDPSILILLPFYVIPLILFASLYFSKSNKPKNVKLGDDNE